jgi:hypothetical protein
MKLEYFIISLAGVKVSVHDVDSKEEGLIFAFEGSKDFNHPINHLGSVYSIDLMDLHMVL